jgi:hypothetical protein
MNNYLIIFILLLLVNCKSKTSNTTLQESVQEEHQPKDSVSFTAVFDSTEASKDGYGINEFIVNVPYKEVKKLQGKKIKVRGVVTIVKGIGKTNKENISLTDIKQGRETDTKHINNPFIEIIK